MPQPDAILRRLEPTVARPSLENLVPRPSLPSLLTVVLGLTLCLSSPASLAKKPSESAKSTKASKKKKSSKKRGKNAKSTKASKKEKSSKKSPTRKLRAPTYHQVSPGDTLSEIAADYGCSSKALMRANRLKKDSVIRIGKKLKLPKCAGVPRSKKEKKSDKEGKAKVLPFSVYFRSQLLTQYT